MNEPKEQMVWDGLIRLFHWSIVLLVPALWASWKFGRMDLHKIFGLTMLGLIVFRLLWGVFGSETARFASFVRGPRVILDHVRGKGGLGQPGHSPLGAVSVVALLLALAVQVSLGLFAQDVDGLESGPLSWLVSYDQADAARNWHEWGFNILLGLIALHLAAIFWYVVVRKQTLIKPMITGRKALDSSIEATVRVNLLRAFVAIALAALLVWWIALGAPVPGLS